KSRLRISRLRISRLSWLQRWHPGRPRSSRHAWYSRSLSRLHAGDGSRGDGHNASDDILWLRRIAHLAEAECHAHQSGKLIRIKPFIHPFLFLNVPKLQFEIRDVTRQHD